MAEKLRSFLLFCLGLCGTIAGIPHLLYGQTAGNVGFTGFNHESVNVFVPGNNTRFEDAEIVVFQLQNVSTGAINPAISNPVMAVNDASAIIINEILFDPAADANGDGITNSGDEFVELVNDGSKDIDISGWTLSDETGVRYTFPSGSVIAGGTAFIVFGEPASGTGFGGARLYAAGSLSLNDGGDTITLKNADGNVVTTFTYSGSTSAEAITRVPDITGSFEPHSTAAGSGGALFSPGTKVDGAAFGSAYAAAFRTNLEGWRMLSSPTQNTTFSDLFSNLWMQGVAGSDIPVAGVTLYSWTESDGGLFVPVANMNDPLTAGKGYIVYVYADDAFTTPGLQGGFPKILRTNEAENATPVTVSVSATDVNSSGDIDGNEGWNMLGNPYGTHISVTEVKKALEAVNSNLNANIAVWDATAGSGNGGYEQLNDGDLIAPFQAFWVRYTAAMNGTANFDRSILAANEGTTVLYDKPSPPHFEIYLGDGEKFDTYRVMFMNEGTIGEDRQDAYKLFSLNAESLNLFSTIGQGVKLAVNALPPLEQLEQEIRIPLNYQLPHSGEYTFTWGEMEALPQNIDVHLVDNKTGNSINLKTGRNLSFRYQLEEKQKLKTKTPLLNETADVKSTPRFELLLTPTDMVKESNDEMAEPVTLSPNFPNPFRNSTDMTIKLREPTRVTITIWNIVGQKVDTIMENAMISDNSYTYTWNADTDLPSGIYICKLEAAGEVLIRKMTLIK